MAKTLKARLSELNINSSYQLKTPRYTTDGPYKFTQDGLEEIVEWNDFKYDVTQIKKMMSPKGPFYEAMCSPESVEYSYKDTKTPDEDRELFKLDWIAMYDQFVSMATDIKASGGLFISPDFEYFKEKFDKIDITRNAGGKVVIQNPTEATSLRVEFSSVIKECIAHNYKEVQRLNALLEEKDKIVPLARSKNHMERVTKEVEKSFGGKGGK